MKRILFGGAIVALALGAAFLFSPKPELQAPSPTPSLSPTIHTTGTVTVTQDVTERQVSSGETIEAPFTLTTDETGTARVAFADGSELRLDRSSSIHVSRASYNESTKDLLVNTRLTIGRVWSSILALATPESSWEVETSNVVGTVRGTAFGMEVFQNGDTKVTGSEHRITLTLVDPDTGMRDEERTLDLSEDEFVIIRDEDARDEGAAPKAEKRTMREASDPWIMENEGRDRETRGGKPEANNEAIEKTIDETSDVVDLTDRPETVDRTEPATLPLAKPPVQATRPEPRSMRVLPARALSGIEEGTPVDMKASVTYSDGSTKDISGQASWKVLGDIGAMKGNTFNPSLAPNVSEFGRALGSVSASWKDEETGKELQGATEIFEVKAKVVPLGTEEG